MPIDRSRSGPAADAVVGRACPSRRVLSLDRRQYRLVVNGSALRDERCLVHPLPRFDVVAVRSSAARSPGGGRVLQVSRRRVTHPVDAARSAGLVYSSDDRPGIRRQRRGSTFRYIAPDGRAVRSSEELARIKRLAIPPAWTDVWIAPSPRAHLQATGRDARGRKQYRYHPRWREVRDETKYGRMIDFAHALSRAREITNGHLALPGLPREKVLAAVVQLLEKTLIRVGNEEYARTNRSFGLTTMQDGHVDLTKGRVRFRFRGKAGTWHEIDLADRRLAAVVERCRDLPGYELFQYIDEEGAVRDVDSADVNEYLREITGQDFTAKDFRTWAGTVLAARALQEFQAFDSKAEAKRNVVRAIESVAKRLGNTSAVCRKCYVHPAILDAYLDGTMVDVLKERAQQALRTSLDRLRPEEAAVLALLERRLAAESAARKSA